MGFAPEFWFRADEKSQCPEILFQIEFACSTRCLPIADFMGGLQGKVLVGIRQGKLTLFDSEV